MRKTIYTIAAAAAIFGGGVAAAAPAMASPNPNSGPIEVNSQSVADGLMAQGFANKSIDVPAGANVQLRWFTENGNVTVEGVLSMTASTVNGNVTVSGGNSELALFNDPGNHITGNLVVQGSAGQSGGNSYGTSLFDNSGSQQQVDGGLTFINNAGRAYIGGPLHVNGKFTHYGNISGQDDFSGLTWGGQEVTG